MKLGCKVQWDPVAAKFINDEQANEMVARTERAPYGTRRNYESLSRKVG